MICYINTIGFVSVYACKVCNALVACCATVDATVHEQKWTSLVKRENDSANVYNILALVAHFVTYLSRTSCSVWVCTKEGYDKCLAYGLDPRKASRNLNDPRPLAEPCRAATNQTTDDVPR